MEAVGQLAGGLAHDYNNLLTVILGNAELLHADAPNQELEEIIRAARTATRVTNRLLTFSRHTNRSLRVAGIADEVKESRPLIERAVGKRVTIVLDCAPDVGFVCIDNSQVQQMLLNLALNAKDAMPQGGTLSITTRSQSLAGEEAKKRQVQPGSYVVLAVRDTGIGMDESTLPRIFEPFFTTKAAGMGTGLGLCMVFGAMKQCGGFVEASSELGSGSCFQLWFPRVSPPLESLANRSRASERALHVLLVEDSEPVLKLASAMLHSAGHRVRVAASGAEALARWSEEPADVLVTDVVMPEMSGVTLADELRRQAPSLPVLFITGYLPDRVGLSAQAAHSAVVMKPFQRRELLSALDALVTGSPRLHPEKSVDPDTDRVRS